MQRGKLFAAIIIGIELLLLIETFASQQIAASVEELTAMLEQLRQIAYSI